MVKPRSRVLYFVLLVFTILLGLTVRGFSPWTPRLFNLYAGDVLWGAMVYLVFAFVFYKSSPKALIFVAIAFSLGVELSQLYHTPWLDAFRSSPIGGLLLGRGFLFSDLICYIIGCQLALGVDYLIIKKQAK